MRPYLSRMSGIRVIPNSATATSESCSGIRHRLMSRCERSLVGRIGASGAEIPGNVNHNDPLIALQQKKRFQNRGSFVVKKVVIPAALNEFRDQNSDLLVRTTPLRFENVLHDRGEDQSKTRRQDHQLRSSHSSLLSWFFDVAVPLLLKGRLPFTAV